jgi:RNA polymerase sigma factor (sigma-70 family)
MQRFVTGHDQAAFEALVRRHGPMVVCVCRRILRDEHDAEDAFQATFLVLARKAAALRRQASVGNWLYGVATRLALRARADAARRRDRERRATGKDGRDSLAELTVREAQEILDEELTRLPALYRVPLVLCCLEGLARDEAAQQLGCGPATLKSRLERGRALLRRRLAGRGLVLPAALLASLLAGGFVEAAVPPPLLESTAKAAAAFAAGSGAGALVSPAAVALAEGALGWSSVSKLKAAALLLVAALVCGGAAAYVLCPDPGPGQPEARAEPAAPALSADWPQWRGPNRDGVVHGAAVPAKWPKALKEEWKVPVGKGVASPVVVGGSVYLLTRPKGDDEVVLCLDLQSGKENWRSEPYPAPYKVGPGEGTADDRPRSTPAVADGRVFTLGMTGVLLCLDAKSGKLLWRKDTKYAPYMGSSPLVADGLCIICVSDGAKTGGLTAFDAKTGDVRWRLDEGGSAMSGSPILVDLAGERQVVTYSNWNACGVSAATGKKLWGVGPGGAGMPCTTPVRYKDWIILADNMDSLRALRLERGDKGLTAKDVWKARGDLKLYYSSPVVAGDLVFGMSTKSGGCFFCLDAKSGTTLWESDGRQGGYASILNLGNVLLFLKDRGQLLVVKPSAAAFEPIAEYRVSDRATMAHPVFLGDRILIKDDVTLRSFRIEPEDGKR